MSKALMLNKDNVVIAVADYMRFVRVNSNGIAELCKEKHAQAYIGNDDQIYAKAGANLIPSYTDISCYVVVDDEVAADAEPLTTKYEGNEIIDNEDEYPLDNERLTEQMTQTRSDVDYIAMMMDVSI